MLHEGQEQKLPRVITRKDDAGSSGGSSMMERDVDIKADGDIRCMMAEEANNRGIYLFHFLHLLFYLFHFLKLLKYLTRGGIYFLKTLVTGEIEIKRNRVYSP